MVESLKLIAEILESLCAELIASQNYPYYRSRLTLLREKINAMEQLRASINKD